MDKLEQAIINMLETQAVTQSQMAAFQGQMTKLAERQLDADKHWFEVKEEQVKIREELNQVIRILQEHTVLLQRMPQAVKESVGFKAG